MGTIVISLLIAAGLVGYLFRLFNKSDSPTTRVDEHQQEEPDDEFKKAQHTIKAAMDACYADHEPAVHALLWLAGSDGTISKQEARNVFRFCEKQGTALPKGTYDALEYLNNGMHISTNHSLSEALSELATLTAKTIQYRAAFIGAAHAICGGNKRISKAKQDFLDSANRLVEGTA